ncbi:hypothetical protein TDB9533_04121 [Thalassocella blandensis]|nr:hypothetical protein TDB9533_04121 [Thalassocella blandensis]
MNALKQPYRVKAIKTAHLQVVNVSELLRVLGLRLLVCWFVGLFVGWLVESVENKMRHTVKSEVRKLCLALLIYGTKPFILWACIKA